MNNKASFANSKNVYRLRIKKILSLLVKENASLVLASSGLVNKSLDQNYEFHQNSDFFYLTGSKEKDQVLILSGKTQKGYLLAKPNNLTSKIWEGSVENPKSRANLLNLECLITNDDFSKTLELIKGAQKVYLNKTNPPGISQKVITYLSQLSSINRSTFPSLVDSSDKIIHPMRLIKDSHEISLIKESISVCAQAIYHTVPLIDKNSNENIISQTFAYWVGVLGGKPAFSTISACGKNASILHYTKNCKKLKSTDLLLLDCGAQVDYYCSDITRVFPVAKKFTGWQRDLYQLVLDSQKKAISKIRPGVKILVIYNAAAKILFEGLKHLKILSGSFESNIKNGKFKKFFPHGIGHSLGIDVHDVGGHRENNQAILKKDMIFTIEPGIYFRSKCKHIPAMGIRIEDDILITKDGCKILSDYIPKEIEDIEALLS